MLKLGKSSPNCEIGDAASLILCVPTRLAVFQRATWKHVRAFVLRVVCTCTCTCTFCSNFGSADNRSQLVDHHMAMKRRASGVHLESEDATKLLDDNVLVESLSDGKKLWPYGADDEIDKLWKRSPRWSDLWTSRHFLADLVASTGGRVLAHSSWHRALSAWLSSHTKMSSKERCMKSHTCLCERTMLIVCCFCCCMTPFEFVSARAQPQEILRAAYRSRCMLAHLRDARRHGKTPPARFAQLQPLIDAMVLDAKSDEDDDDDDDDNEAAALEGAADRAASLDDEVSIVKVTSQSEMCQAEVVLSSQESFDIFENTSAALTSTPW